MAFRGDGFVDIVGRCFGSSSCVIFRDKCYARSLKNSRPLLRRLVVRTFPGTGVLVVPRAVFFGRRGGEGGYTSGRGGTTGVLFLTESGSSCRVTGRVFRAPHITLFPSVIAALVKRGRFAGCEDKIYIYAEGSKRGFCASTRVTRLIGGLSTSAQIVRGSARKLIRCRRVEDGLSCCV